MKKLLVLGGRPIGSCELVNAAKGENIYTIVTDYLPPEASPAKKLADEYWDISTADLDVLEKKIKQENIDGIVTGVHGFNITKMAELTERLRMPCYCTVALREKVANKKSFKAFCEKHGIRVSKEYKLNPLCDICDHIDYPVIVKPADSGGSRGFSICHDLNELRAAYQKALDFSPSSDVLIEEFIPYDAAIIHYNAKGGNIQFCGLTEKYSMKLGENGSSVMALQLMPSPYVNKYLKDLNEKVIAMFQDIGITDGPIWIEAFNHGGEFIFNEMGYRFGGSMTNYPVKYFYGIDQLKEMIHLALNIREETKTITNLSDYSGYCILPIHINRGKITKITGENNIKKLDQLEAVARVHYLGDDIQELGTANQVFCYLHIKYNTLSDLKETIRHIREQYKVYDEHGNQMLFYLMDTDHLKDGAYGKRI